MTEEERKIFVNEKILCSELEARRLNVPLVNSKDSFQERRFSNWYDDYSQSIIVEFESLEIKGLIQRLALFRNYLPAEGMVECQIVDRCPWVDFAICFFDKQTYESVKEMGPHPGKARLVRTGDGTVYGVNVHN